eukprot:TRINITY_DN6934_c0_g1_i1.p1 TRINITY_DN6934_c0_g1~~TRINITY_DN6934_c0_g1_i1.p1  ORF type:complete len:478 (-),score=109.05 TRINITY_DN6934_c0_g1_i1:377-1810(-)
MTALHQLEVRQLLLLAALTLLCAPTDSGPDLDVRATDSDLDFRATGLPYTISITPHAPTSSGLPGSEPAAASEPSGHSDAQVPHWYHSHETIAPADGDSARLRFTAEVQQDIWRHQNPPTCEGQRYIETPHHGFGLGSILNRASGMLGFAMNEGVIMLYYEKLGSPNFLGSYCAGILNPACIFMPPSNCTAYARNHRNNVTVEKNYLDHSYPTPVVPDKWVQRWAETDMSSSGMVNLQYWWRAQAAGYFTRLNARTSQEMIARRMRSAASGAAPLPLPPNTISVHVRHGDKSSEMKLASWKEHLARADRLAHKQGFSERFIYLSTDDPKVVHAVHTPLQDPLYSVFSLPCPELMDGSGVLPCRTNITTANPGLDVAEHGAHAGEIALFAVESLLLALEGTHFVGQRGSSWARLIDELRMVVVGSSESCCLPYGNVSCDLPVSLRPLPERETCQDGSPVDTHHPDQCQCPEDAEEFSR